MLEDEYINYYESLRQKTGTTGMERDSGQGSAKPA